MKKKVKFEKVVDFATMISEITAISLDKDLSFKNESLIEGNLVLNGKYKLTEASVIEEDFEFKIPIEISLVEKVDNSTATIEISDFYYELNNNDSMTCHIELCIDALEIIDDLDEERECDGENVEMEIPHIEDIEVSKNEDAKNNGIDSKIELINDDNNDNNDNNDSSEVPYDDGNDSLFVHLDDKSETYGTFIVYIVRQNETINSIIDKYNTTIEEIEKYNDLKDINIGTKLIIPLLND